MKSKMKHFSKSSLSMLLALIMLVSTVAVGIVTSNAAFKDLASSGDLGSDSMTEWWIVGYQNDNFDNWSASFKDYSISSNTGTITVTSSSSDKIYFKLVSTASNDDRYLSKPSNGTTSLAKGTTYELEGSTNGDNPFKNWTDLRDAYTQLDYTPSGNQDYIDFTITTSNNKKYLTITERNITPDFYVVGRFKNDSVQDDWSSTTTNYHFTETSTGIYKYETQQNLTELSSEIQCTGYNAVQYFYIWDKNSNVYYNTASNRNAMENVYTSAHSVSLSSCTFNSDGNWLYFGSDNSSYGVSKDSDLVFWVDTTGTTPKFYYTTADTATYTVTATAGSNGSVSPGSATAGDASTAEFTATASSGYEFTSWTLSDGVTPASGYTTSSNPIKVHASKAGSVQANFSKSNWPPVNLTGYTTNTNCVYTRLNSDSLQEASATKHTDVIAKDGVYWVSFSAAEIEAINNDKSQWSKFFVALAGSSNDGVKSVATNTATVNTSNCDTTNLVNAGGSTQKTNYLGTQTERHFAQLEFKQNRTSDLKHLGVLIDASDWNKPKYTFYTGYSYDPFYIGGRFVTASAHTGSYSGDWETQSKAIKFAGSGNVWTLDTGKTIAELSTPLDNSTHTSTNPQYFIIHDGVTNYAVAAADTSGWNFEKYKSKDNALTLGKVSSTLLTDHEMVFDDTETTSDGKVVLHIDATNYTAGAGTLKIWYTLRDETPGVADALTFTVSPEVTTVGKYATLTATISGVNGAIDDVEDLDFYFTAQNGSVNTHVTGSDIKALSGGRYRATLKVTNANQGTYPYTVTVSALNNNSLRSVTKSASGTWNAQTVYYTNDITSSEATASWTAVSTDTKVATINATVSAGNSYTIALSDEAQYNPAFADFTIDTELTKYCDIKMGSKTVTIDNEDRVVRTYVITPRTNCSNPVITIDAEHNKIYAVASFDKYGNSTKTLSNTTETVKYYFAKPADKDFSGDNKLDGNKGLHIGYYNNSVVSKGGKAWAVPVKADGATSTGNYTASASTYMGTEPYQIYIDESQLFEYKTGNKKSSTATKTVYNVYVLELPIWATSAWLVGSNSADQISGNNILSLNPNRIYVFWTNSSGTKQWSGVPLDTSFWVTGQASGTPTRGDTGYANNQVPTKNFKTNLINYKTSADYSETMNAALSAEYANRSIDRRLYWGMFAVALENSVDFNAGDYNWGGFYYPLNLAQRSDSNHAYYASMWNTVNPELSKNTSKNPLGGGMLRAYGSDALMPFFDYEYLTGAQDVGTAYTDKDFPFYASQFDGVTTYSYDSAVDLNRHYKVSTGKYEVESGVTKLGNNIGYQPFHNESVTDTAAGFANEYDINFYMTTTGVLQGTKGTHDISFNFSGDDDVWVFVDGVLVLDLGGAHKISAGSINFSDMKVYYKTAAADFADTMGCKEAFATSSDSVYTMDLKKLFEAYGIDFNNKDATTKHTLQMFYTERGRLESNMSLSFNLPQASGLNVRNTVTADNVNAGLKEAALAASNRDYFTYAVKNAEATYADITALRNKGDFYANAILPSTTSGWQPSNITPVYPYKYNLSRVFGGESLLLSSASDSRNENGGSVISSLGSAFTPLKNTVYALTDKYVDTDDKDAKLSGITDNTDAAAFHLLGGEMANFTDKVRPNSFVQVYQTQELGEAVTDSTNNDIIKYSAVSHNNAGNYFITSFDIHDEAAKKDVVEKQTYSVRYGDNDIYYANDASSENAFYFTNYANDEGNVNPAMTVNFYNDIAVGKLRVEKEVSNSSTANDNFYFRVEFANIFGDTDLDWAEYDVEYMVYNASDDSPITETPQSYGTVGIVIKPGQYAEITGIPVETRYRVTEVSRAGYTLSDIDKTAKKLNGAAINTTYVPSGFYEFANQSVATAGTSDGVTKEGWSNGNMTALDKTYTDGANYTYYCNMIPVVPETYVDASSDYQSLSNIVFTNKKENYTIQFKYYDRRKESGTTTGIESSATTYSISCESIPSTYIVYEDGDESKGVESIKFDEWIAANAVEFTKDVDGVSNLMCDYDIWTSQAAAVTAMDTKKYFDNGTLKDYEVEERPYHTTYLGKPNTTGERWVNYYDNKGNAILEEDIKKGSDYLNVKNIVVWCYNYPKQYEVNVYGADSFDDLIDKPVGSNTTVYVADASTTDKSERNKMFYYNQRFGTATGAPDLDDAGFISLYGLSGVNEYNLCPQDYASAAISNGDKTYNFAYWAYDQAGTQLASTDIKYKYRVSKNTDLYAVYVESSAEAMDKVGLSITANPNDNYVDSNGTPYTRLNILANVYNAPDYDPNIKKLAFVNVSLSKQVSGKTPAQINALFNQYKDQLKTLIKQHDDASQFSFNDKDKEYTNVNLTLTTKGYIYTITSNGNTPAEGEPEMRLTNKNRGQFTISYKTSALVKDDINPTCLVYNGAVKYNNEWKISDNCLIYYNGKVIDNSADSWS